MGDAIGEMLPLAIGIAISPLAIVAVILILTTPRARTNGLAFLGGWLLALAVVGGVTLVVTDAAESADSNGPRTIVAVLKIALGVALLVLAWRGFRSRPKPGDEAPLPKWMAALDRFTPGRSLSMGALFGGSSPRTSSSPRRRLRASRSPDSADPAGRRPAPPHPRRQHRDHRTGRGIRRLGEEKAARVLDGWKTWLQTNNSAVMIVLFVVFGVVLLGKGIGGL